MKKILISLFLVGALTFAEGNTVETRIGLDVSKSSKAKFNDSKFDSTSKVLKNGFEVGVEYRRDLGMGFEIGGGIFYKRNRFNKENMTSEPLTDTNLDGTYRDLALDEKYKGFDSFPVYATARYNFYTGNDVKPYIKANLGYAMNSGSYESIYAENGTHFFTDAKGRLEEKIKFKNGIYYGIGTGVRYNQFSVDLSYNVIESKFENTYMDSAHSHVSSITGHTSSYGYATTKGKLRNQFVTLSIGYNFDF